MKKQFMEILDKYVCLEKDSSESRVHVIGATYQRDRLVAALRLSFQKCRGDAIEIGCMSGGTSVMLAEVCKEFDRKLVCVDPWANLPGYEWIDFESKYCVFLETVADYMDFIEVIRLKSQDPEAVERIQKHKYAFAFVDGGHETDLVIADLKTVMPCTDFIIASDDHRYDVGVQLAHETIKNVYPEWTFHSSPYFREAWFIK